MKSTVTLKCVKCEEEAAAENFNYKVENNSTTEHTILLNTCGDSCNIIY